MARAIAITSGKGGVGKTNAATNIGIALSRLGRRVCIFDADLGLANVNILTGQTPTRTLEHLVNGECSIEELVMEGPAGLRVVPSGSGVEKLRNLGANSLALLKGALETLEGTHDYLLIDTAAGIGPDVLGFVSAAHEAIVVVSPDPTSLTDAYALVKVLHRQGYDKQVSILVNMAAGEEEAARIFASLSNAAKKFLGMDLKPLGHVVRDYALASSVMKQKPVTVLFPEAHASRCFQGVAALIDSGFGPNGVGGFSGAWTTLLALERAPKKQEPGAEAAGGATLDQLSRWIESGATSEAEAREGLSRLESGFLRRFGKPHADFRTALFNMLDFTEVSPGSLKEAALLLESIHERRFGKPLFEAEDAMLKALSLSESETGMRNLLSKLEGGFERRFGQKPSTLEERLETEGRAGTLAPERIRAMVTSLCALHKRSTGETLKTEGTALVSDLAPLVQKFDESEKWLAEIASILEILSADREELGRRLEALTGDCAAPK